MNSILLPAAFAIALAGGSVVAVQHNVAVHGDTAVLADSGGGDGGMDRRAIQTADGSGGGDGGYDRRVTERA